MSEDTENSALASAHVSASTESIQICGFRLTKTAPGKLWISRPGGEAMETHPSKLHPDLSTDIEQIDMFAQQVGISLGKQSEVTQLQNQFYSALPYDIKQQLQG